MNISTIKELPKEVNQTLFEIISTEIVDYIITTTKEIGSDLPENVLKETITYKLENLGFTVGEKFIER